MHTAVALLLTAVLGSAATAAPVPLDAKSEADLIALEKGKWDPSSLGDPKAMVSLFADDFVSVEYGADVNGGVKRKTKAEVFSGGPLPPAKFELSDFKTIKPSADSVILSYHVHGLSFAWDAYATSVWAKRAGKWTTVFYQASTAAPSAGAAPK